MREDNSRARWLDIVYVEKTELGKKNSIWDKVSGVSLQNKQRRLSMYLPVRLSVVSIRIKFNHFSFGPQMEFCTLAVAQADPQTGDISPCEPFYWRLLVSFLAHRELYILSCRLLSFLYAGLMETFRSESSTACLFLYLYQLSTGAAEYV